MGKAKGMFFINYVSVGELDVILRRKKDKKQMGIIWEIHLILRKVFKAYDPTIDRLSHDISFALLNGRNKPRTNYFLFKVKIFKKVIVSRDCRFMVTTQNFAEADRNNSALIRLIKTFNLHETIRFVSETLIFSCNSLRELYFVKN